MRRVLTVGVLTAGVMLGIAPAARALPPPDPDPVVPTPDLTVPAVAAPGSPVVESGATGCQDGQAMQNGNCVPAMSAVPSTAGGGADDPVPIRVTDTQTSTFTTGIGADLVPNLNGTPCTGYWSSMACNAAGDVPAVQPRSTLSTSP